MRNWKILLGALLLAAAASPAAAQSVADFYKGKQIEYIIAAETGSIYDTWGRMLARHMSKYLPGNPTFIPKNMPGAGHIRAAGYSFNVAPKDGTSIVTFSHNIPASYMLKNPAITFDVSKFQWLGSPDLPGRMCVVGPRARVQRAVELFQHELLVGGAGAGGGISQTPKLVAGLLGMKMKLVEGYKGGGDALLAVERGEIEGMCATVEGIENERAGWVAQGKLKALFNMERKPIPELNAPSIFEFAKTEEQRQVLGFYGSTMEFGFPTAAPPGVPADRVDALRRALDATVKDPAFVAEATRAKMKVTPVTGEELTQRMSELTATPPEVIKKTGELMGGESDLAMGDFRAGTVMSNITRIIVGVFALAGLGAGTAAADPVADFYRGKQIEVIVATESGSIYDTWGRMMARHLGKQIPGNPTLITKNMPGAGHIRAAGYEFNAAPKDGTSIITFSHNLPTSYVMGNPGMKFDFSKFRWLGSPDHPGRVCVVRRGATVQKAPDLFDHELLVAGAGAAAAISQTPKLLSGLLGMKFRLVEGYKGAPEAMLAVDRGEVEGICTTIDGVEGERPGAIQDGRLKVLFNTERDPIPELHAPSVFEFTKTDEQRQILGFYSSTVEFGIPFAAPPEVPPERLDALRRAFAAVADDPEFRTEVARAKMGNRPVTGEQLAQRMRELMATPKSLIKQTSDLLGGNPF